MFLLLLVKSLEIFRWTNLHLREKSVGGTIVSVVPQIVASWLLAVVKR